MTDSAPRLLYAGENSIIVEFGNSIDLDINAHVQALRKTRLLPLAELRAVPALASLRVLQRGNRLSITPVTDEEWAQVQSLL